MTNNKTSPASRSIMVVGGGIAGLTTAIEAAEIGYEVFLVEQNPYLGGRVAQLNKYFPKLCPPTCGLEINFRRIKENPRISVFTLSEIKSVSGNPGNYDVKIRTLPRYVNDNCTCCGKCSDVCELEVLDEYNLDMSRKKAAHLPFGMAFPHKYVVSPQVIGTPDAEKIKDVCEYDAIDLNMTSKDFNISVGSIVWATGWKPYDAHKIENLGFGRYDNIVTNMMLERLSSKDGPTNGRILRPLDNKPPSSFAFVQCAGSRDENHLPYCSYVCCMASLKHTTYIREQYPDAKIYIFYIDIRSFGDKYEKFYRNIKLDKNVFFIKGKVADVIENSENGNITVVAENSITGEKVKKEVEMVVLATGMQPSCYEIPFPVDLKFNEDGFIINDFEKGGLFAAGCATKPADVISSNQNATGVALKAIQTLVKK